MPIAGEKYRHYKSTGGDDHTYQIIGLAKHTESGEILVVYKPLYIIDEMGLFNIFARPSSIREEDVVVDGNVVKRFVQID